MRKLPDLIIVGAQKSGTTSIWNWLRDHPECYMSDVKEPHYFASFGPTPTLLKKGWFVRDPIAYANLFKNAKDNQICGEASPSYLFDPTSANKILKSNPNTKIIIGLRDPLERAYSEYQMNVFAGIEKRKFLTAISEDSTLIKEDWNSPPLYFELSKYGTQVKRYSEIFPKDQIYFITNEDLNNNTKQEMINLSKFLAISEEFWEDYAFVRMNVGAEPINQFSERLLGSKYIRGLGRLFVPYKFRGDVAKLLFGKGGRKKVFSEEEKAIFWTSIMSEIILLQEISGTHFPSLWKTFPSNWVR